MKKKSKEEFCFACGTQQPCYDGCIEFKKYFDIQLTIEQEMLEKTRSPIEFLNLPDEDGWIEYKGGLDTTEYYDIKLYNDQVFEKCWPWSTEFKTQDRNFINNKYVAYYRKTKNTGG